MPRVKYVSSMKSKLSDISNLKGKWRNRNEFNVIQSGCGYIRQLQVKNTIEWGIYSFTNKIFNYPDTLPGGFQVKVLMLFELWKPT